MSYVRLLVGWSVGQSVCHNFKKKEIYVHFHAPIGALIQKYIVVFSLSHIICTLLYINTPPSPLSTTAIGAQRGGATVLRPPLFNIL